MFIKFIIVGVINTLLNLLTMSIFLNLGFFYLFSSVLGFVVGAFSGFTINFFWTFSNKFNFYQKFLKYFSIQVLNLFLTVLIVFLMVSQLSVHALISQSLAIIITTFTNYFLSRKLVFTNDNLK